MRIVLDTNVLVSGLLTPFGSSGEIVRMIFSGELILCIDARILSEYKEVLYRPKFNFDKEHIDNFLNEIKFTGSPVLSTLIKKSLPDQNDNMFLEVAISGNVEYIITGNTNHFPEQLCQSIIVYTPADFIKYYSKCNIKSS